MENGSFSISIKWIYLRVGYLINYTAETQTPKAQLWIYCMMAVNLKPSNLCKS